MTPQDRVALVNDVLANLNNDWLAAKRQAFLENLAAYIKGHHCPTRIEAGEVVFTHNGQLKRVSGYGQARAALGYVEGRTNG